MQAKKINFPCKCLRSKEMFYGEAAGEDSLFAGGVYWCTRTQDALGPDGQPVERQECMESRTCYLR